MSSRAASELLLVGSLPAQSTDEAFRAGAELFGDLVFALPDGETGPRAAWVGYERERLVRPNPDVEVVEETDSPTGIPRHAYETPVFKIRAGAGELHFDTWPRIDDAIASWREFRALRDEGVIPAGLRFQVGLPFPSSALNGFKADFAGDYPVAERAYEDLVGRELVRLLDEVPASDLAIQWDMAYEVQDIEGVLAWTAEGAWERYAGPVGAAHAAGPRGRHARLPLLLRHVPGVADVRGPRLRGARADGQLRGRELGAHRRLGAHGRAALPAIEDKRFFRPLSDLDVGDTRVYLGIVLPLDGLAGLRRRATASRYLSDFGVAMYCGFGRQPGADGMQTMREHRDVVRALRRDPIS